MILRRLAFLTVATIIGVAILPTTAHADYAREQQWHLSFLHVAEAHKISQGEGITVAVADSGVDPTAPELASSVVAGKEFGRTGDGRSDTDGHGTAMAGLIAGRGKGANDGVLGIAPRSTILPVRVSPAPSFGGNPNNLADGINWAVTQGAKVICIALGTSAEPKVKTAIENALAANVVIVAAAGNKPTTTRVDFPAKLPGVLAVNGVDQQGQIASVSVTGPEVVLAAPGVNIVSTGIEKQYRTGTGTSDATAIVAGAVALVRAKYPQLSGPEVIRRLTYTAQDKGAPGRDNEYGYGVLDLVKALTAEVPPASSAAPASDPAGATPKDNSDSNQVAWFVAIGAAVVVVVFILVLQMIIRSRRRSTERQPWNPRPLPPPMGGDTRR